MMVVAMNDGRVLNGLLKEQSPRTITLQTQTEVLMLERSAIAGLRPSPSSLMPDGLLDSLNAEETRDLIAYLRTRPRLICRRLRLRDGDRGSPRGPRSARSFAPARFQGEAGG